MTDGNDAFSYEHKLILKITNKSTAIDYIYILSIWYVIHCIMCRCSESNKQYSFKVRSGLISALPTVKIKLLFKEC